MIFLYSVTSCEYDHGCPCRIEQTQAHSKHAISECRFQNTASACVEKVTPETQVSNVQCSNELVMTSYFVLNIYYVTGQFHLD